MVESVTGELWVVASRRPIRPSRPSVPSVHTFIYVYVRETCFRVGPRRQRRQSFIDCDRDRAATITPRHPRVRRDEDFGAENLDARICFQRIYVCRRVISRSQ